MPMCIDPAISLESLAHAAAEGDRRALELFAEEACEIALKLAEIKLQWNKIRRWIDPCDVAQIVSFKACQIAGDPARNSAVGHWPALIRQMTLRTITDMARSLKKELGTIHSQALIVMEACGNRDGRDSIESHELREHHRAMILEIQARLPEPLRPIWHLRAEGFTWKSIARIHGAHPQTMRIRFNTAIERISRKVRRSEYDRDTERVARC
jgi:DNA-directed RNA polymerase specialized sigma24 family protein